MVRTHTLISSLDLTLTQRIYVFSTDYGASSFLATKAQRGAEASNHPTAAALKRRGGERVGKMQGANPVR